MSNLSSKEKDQLKNAVERITDYCEDGLSPNTAIIKTAQELKLTPDRLPVLVNAYNAGATAERWNSSDSLREKVASFPIADLDEIRKTLYPQNVKQASAPAPKSLTYIPSPEVLFGENLLDCYKSPLPTLQKSASYSTRERVNLNKETRDAMRVAERQSVADLDSAVVDVEVCLNKLAKVIARPDVPEFETLKKTASLVYGQSGANIMTYIEESFPQRAKMSKTASVLKANHPFHTLMKEAIGLTEKVLEAQKQAGDIHEKCASMREEMDERWKSEIYGNKIKRLLLTPAEVKRAALEKKNLTKQAFREEYDTRHNHTLLDDLTHPEWSGATEREYGILNALDDDNHTANLRNIQTETMFTDLINTDDFLSKQDPEAVLEAYNDLLEVSPELRNKKVLLRQALRQYMASESLDLASIAQLQQMDKIERDKKNDAKKTMVQNSKSFDSEQRKQQIEDRKHELDVRKLEEDIRQKERDREQRQRLEEARLRSAEREGAANRASQEELARHQRRRQAFDAQYGRESNEDINRRTLLAQSYENSLARAQENKVERAKQEFEIQKLKAQENAEMKRFLIKHELDVTNSIPQMEEYMNNRVDQLLAQGLSVDDAMKVMKPLIDDINKMYYGSHRIGLAKDIQRASSTVDDEGNPISMAAPTFVLRSNANINPIYNTRGEEDIMDHTASTLNNHNAYRTKALDIENPNPASLTGDPDQNVFNGMGATI